jgi:4-hydroxybenzoate polyprenyltransferase
MVILPNGSSWEALGLELSMLLVATTGLYGGGVVFNDVFDASLDAEERPERPIPSGRVSRSAAAWFGAVWLVIGILAAATVSMASAVIAILVAIGALTYDAYSKHRPLLGPLNMGLCRGGNLLLGVSIVPAMLGDRWFLAALPVLYIAAITAISQGEVHGGRSRTGWIAVGLMGLVAVCLLGLELLPSFAVWKAAPFLIVLLVQVGPPFVRAAQQPAPARIRTAVRAGILALITLNATLTAGFAGWIAGLVVLLLLPLSLALARLFAVT